MNHSHKGRKFGREDNLKRTFLSGLAANLVLHEAIETTTARAKEIRPQVEKYVTLAKKQNLASLRLLLSRLPRRAAMRLYYEIAPRYKERAGGYLRITKIGKTRKRDAAPVARIEFIK